MITLSGQTARGDLYLPLGKHILSKEISHMPRLFDAYIMVDWSAASKPTTGPNSIWIGILAKDARLKFQFTAVNPDTRLKAVALIKDLIEKLNKRGDRVLLGFDFSMGYPAGTAAALGLDMSTQPAWLAMQRFLVSKMKDKPDNSNARFAIAAGMNYKISQGPFPFWGAPARDQVKTLTPKKGDFDTGSLPEYRVVEQHLRETIKAKPKSVWQLAYTGSVGSQSLTGIPHVQTLLNDLPNAKLWPFQTGLKPLDAENLDGVQTVIAEVYPSMVKITPEAGEVLDMAQVRTIARHYCDLDGKGRLGALFGPPKALNVGKIAQIEAEEGWILS